jgi:predicted XRE-type DNA-binding protein
MAKKARTVRRRERGEVRTSGNNVFADLGFGREEAEHLRIRAALMITLQEVIDKRRLTQVEAAALLDVSQPRISDLLRGKIGLFSIDTLVNMLARAGVRVHVRTTALVK